MDRNSIALDFEDILEYETDIRIPSILNVPVVGVYDEHNHRFINWRKTHIDSTGELISTQFPKKIMVYNDLGNEAFNILDEYNYLHSISEGTFLLLDKMNRIIPVTLTQGLDGTFRGYNSEKHIVSAVSEVGEIVFINTDSLWSSDKFIKLLTKNERNDFIYHEFYVGKTPNGSLIFDLFVIWPTNRKGGDEFYAHFRVEVSKNLKVRLLNRVDLGYQKPFFLPLGIDNNLKVTSKNLC